MSNRTLCYALLIVAFFSTPRAAQARWLDPSTGRFWTVDTFEGDREDPRTLHKYLYYGGDPVNRSDPTGQDFVSDIMSSLPTELQIRFTIAKWAQPLNYTIEGTTQKAQLDQVGAAYREAKNYADEAVRYMSSVTYPNAPARYTRWFGAPSPDRIEEVKDTYRKIDSVFASQTIRFVVTGGSYYGHSVPSWIYGTRIDVGTKFWSTPLTGANSKAGTLIHELSHNVSIVTGINETYGAAACMQLAVNHPGRAVENGDNYEYFVELK